MKRLLFILSFSFGCIACPKPVPTPTPLPEPSQMDGGNTGADGAPGRTDAVLSVCQLECQKLAALACPAAKPTAKGASCVTVCENIQSSGVVHLIPECVRLATTCNAIDKCNTP